MIRSLMLISVCATTFAAQTPVVIDGALYDGIWRNAVFGKLVPADKLPVKRRFDAEEPPYSLENGETSGCRVTNADRADVGLEADDLNAREQFSSSSVVAGANPSCYSSS